jgi:hypothetical protein
MVMMTKPPPLSSTTNGSSSVVVVAADATERRFWVVELEWPPPLPEELNEATEMVASTSVVAATG